MITEPVGIVEIATRLGVARATVDGWRYKGKMPPPDLIVGGRPAWSWSTIERWARATGHGNLDE